MSSPWPVAGEMWFGGRSEPVTVVGLEPDGEVRIIDAAGRIRRVLEERIRLVEPIADLAARIAALEARLA